MITIAALKWLATIIAILVLLNGPGLQTCMAQPKPKRNPFTGELIKEKVEDKVVVVITGASTGIGRDTAIEFARNPKFKVYATMRDVHKASFTPQSLSEKQAGVAVENIVVKSMDVTSDVSVNACVKDILDETGGRLDIIINNAGYGLSGCLEGVSIDEAQKLFDVNVWGAVRVLQAALPAMRLRRTGYVINVSSTSGIRGVPCMEYYSGSKFALEGIFDSFRYSMSAFNISVTNINPGPVRTKFTDTFGVRDTKGQGTRRIPGEQTVAEAAAVTGGDASKTYLSSLADAVVQSLNRRMASDEAQDSEDVANVIVHLAVMKLASRRIEDIPFNIGTSMNSQAVLEAVRKQPTGWGGMYANLLKSVPPLPKVYETPEMRAEAAAKAERDAAMAKAREERAALQGAEL